MVKLYDWYLKGYLFLFDIWQTTSFDDKANKKLSRVLEYISEMEINA